MKSESRTLLVLFIIALLAPFIANESPLLVKDNDGWHSPFFTNDVVQWNQRILNNDSEINFVLQPLVPWTAGRTDYVNADFAAPLEEQYYLTPDNVRKNLPLRYHHFLGTDLRGSDVLSGLLNALRVTFFIGIVSTLLAMFLAFIAGVVSAWYAADGLKVSRLSLLVIGFIAVVLVIMLRNYAFAPELTGAYWKMIAILLAIYFILRRCPIAFLARGVVLPIDAMMTRVSEVFSTFPRFILVIVFGAFLRPSLLQVIILLAVTGWPDLARVLRAEILRLKEQNFMDAGRISGADSFRLLVKHLLPNAWPVLSVTILYSLAMNILMEAGLGFLGMGIPDNYLSLGGMMAQGKDHLEAWWIILFPGLLLSFTLFCLYRYAESLRPNYDRSQ
jgi:peptide/nickel transport system permease protein